MAFKHLAPHRKPEVQTIDKDELNKILEVDTNKFNWCKTKELSYT